jgi:diaminopimelate decarboxylase
VNKQTDWHWSGSDLVLGERLVSSLVEEYGTPLYLYDGRIALNKLMQIQEAFPDFDVLYSLKANPNLELSRIMADVGIGADVASLHELSVALDAGFAPHSITFGGPGKTYSELKETIQNKVRIIDSESETELRLLEELARINNIEINIILRVNTVNRPSEAGEFMAGIPSQFGIDEEKIFDLPSRFEPKYLRYQGIHVHVASQVLDENALFQHYHKTTQLAQELAVALNFDLNEINFGGGLGVPYNDRESPLDLLSLGQNTQRMLSDTFPTSVPKPRFQLELGRYLLAECGVFLTRIIDVKNSRGVNFVITDTGINGFSRPAMPWAQQHPCTIISKGNEPSTGLFRVVGRSNLPSDVLCKDVNLPNPEPGDILAVHNAGAYGLTMSMVMWSSHTIPKEVIFFDGHYSLAKSIIDSHRPLAA